ncbi:MAG: hypothetical protein V3U48_07055 [Rhodospirillales bacterium]
MGARNESPVLGRFADYAAGLADGDVPDAALPAATSAGAVTDTAPGAAPNAAAE